MTRRQPLLAALMIVALGAAGCSTLSKVNPFHGKAKPSELAGEGKRISIVATDQVLEVSDALKGADFALPPAAQVTDWPLPGGTPEQSVENVDAAPSLSIAWRRGFGRGTKSGRFVTAPPVSAGGRIFVMDAEAGVSAHDAKSGAQIWHTDVRPKDKADKRDRVAFGGGVAYADGKLYVASGYREVVQLDAATGAVGWRTRTEEPIHDAPTVADGRVIVAALDNTLLTFDTATGAAGWSYQALTEPARILAASSAAVSGDTVVASFGSGELVALRASNGNDLWNEALSRASRTSALSEIRDIPGRPVVYKGDVYAVSHSGVFAATDLRSGQARWSLPVVGISTPWPAGDVVYVVAKDGKVICAARESGLVYWIHDLNAGIDTSNKGGMLGGRRGGFFGIGGHKVAKPLWSGPMLSNDRLIFTGSLGQLAVLNAHTGAELKRVNLGAPSLMPPMSVGGMIYVVTDNAQLIALR